jgi:hypothetical protein
VVVLLYNARAMVQVVSVRPTGFWGLWCRPTMGLVAVGRNDYVVQVVDVGFGCAVVMAVEVVGVVDEAFGYAMVMAVVGVADEGFVYAVELCALTLAGGGY